jgi:peptidyl-prolyl cis-trans isomerase D
MFEYIRKHQRAMQFLLLLVIAPIFVLGGLSSYREHNSDDGVATVAGRTITQADWDNAQRRQIDQAREQMGARFDQKLFDTPAAKQAILDQLVAERATEAEAAHANLTVPDEALQRQILAIPAFRKPDGSFDMEQYKAVLAAQGMTPTGFQERIRHDLALQRLAGSIEDTAFVPRTVAGRLSDINDQEREVQEVMFPAANYVAQVKVTDDMVKAYYDKHAAEFQVPEQVKAEYVVFNADAVEKSVTVSDAEIEAFYKANEKRFITPEKRSASHILVQVKSGAPAAEDAAAKAKAEAILAEVRKNPDDFAKIAKAQSQDTGSAELGGDLGAIERNVFAKPVEDAIYSLKEGQVSGLVKSEFGYHIVKVTKVAPPVQQPLEAARPQIAAELKKQKMSARYSDLADQFTNLVYDQADSLKPAADKLGLTIQTAEGLTRTPNPALGAAPYNNEKFLKALFAPDALNNKRNTQAVEVAPSTLVAGRVLDFKPAAKRPLAEVDAAIRQRVTQEEAARLARAAGAAKLAAARGGDVAGFGEAKTVSRTKQPTIDTAAALAVLKADVSKLPAVVGVDVPGKGYGVYRIVKVSQPAQPDVARRQQEAEQIARALGAATTYDFIEALKHKAKAKINVKAADLGARADQAGE